MRTTGVVNSAMSPKICSADRVTLPEPGKWTPSPLPATLAIEEAEKKAADMSTAPVVLKRPPRPTVACIIRHTYGRDVAPAGAPTSGPRAFW